MARPGRRRVVVAAVLGAVVVLAALAAVGAREEPVPFTVERQSETDRQVVTGTAGGRDTYRFVLPEGTDPTAEDDRLVAGPTAAAPTGWSVVVDVVAAESPLDDVVDAGELAARLPAYGDERSLAAEPESVDLAGQPAWAFTTRDEDGEPYVVRTVVADRDGERYVVAMAVPAADEQAWLGVLTDQVLDSWQWLS
ncbi:hypothetical protein [Euzebya sp.]|uniref:hypothetical protein n=1 Tax=Euzebya sp. TaxID=1971409 RepID=UPI003513B7CB